METPSMHRLKEIGPWSEQFSSSGKRYYYNRETEVSQWEKPAEWKQAEREQFENVKASATSTTSATKNSANSSAKISSTSTNKQRHRPGVSTSLTPRSSHTITVKPDSSTPANKICSSSTSNTAKRQRIDEDESKAVSSSSQKKQSANEVSSSTEVHNRNSHHGKEEDHHHGAEVSSSGQASASHKRTCQSGPDQHHNSKANTPTNSLSTPQLQSINVEQKASALRSKHPSSSPSKRSDTPKEQSKESNSPPGTAKNDGGWEQPEVQEGFREEKHLKFYRPDVATSKRHLIPEAYLNDLKKCADRNAKQMASLFAIDNDIHSIRTLIKVGEFRTQLLRQRGDAIAKRIQELDSNGQ